jgi:hypothetical protein
VISGEQAATRNSATINPRIGLAPLPRSVP